jgi:hypothetical protein
MRIKEVTEHMDVALAVNGGDLDTGHDAHAQRTGGGAHRRHGGHGVVIGHGHDGDAGCRDLTRQFLRG